MNLIIAITGSSGVVYGKRLLETCQNLGINTDLIISPAAEEIIEFELEETAEDLQNMAENNYEYDELSAPISSGSKKTSGMAIVPCSMKTLGSIASGVTDNLITRAADVTLKEDRKMVLVPRETPLNHVHLRNMHDLDLAGATVLPPSPGFYHDPQSVEELVDFVVGKVLDQFDIDHQLYESWKGMGEQP